MNLLGFQVTRTKGAQQMLENPDSRGGWWPVIRESFTGAWQKNISVRNDTVLSNAAVYACVTLIASDIAKIGLKLVQKDAVTGIWSETSAPAFSPVLRKPNRYQTRSKFIEQWLISKLVHGNAYILLERDQRQIVVAMYVLHPMRVKPLVAPDGSVLYALQQDTLSGIEDDQIVVPASEIIHDTMVPLFHPLCGVSPIFACGMAAMQGLAIQQNSTKFFQNGSNPGGILTAPGLIAKDTAARLKEYWDQNFTGANVGRVAVLGDGLKYEAMSVNAVDAQLIEQLKWSAEQVCSAYHVPAYMIGVGPPPSYNNIEALNQQYYSQCLQSLIESLEACIDEGLGLVDVVGKTYGSEFDLDDLLRMDTATKVKTYGDAVRGALMSPNEARAKFDLPEVDGGGTPYLQEQNWPLRLLADRELPTRQPTAPAAIAPPTPPAEPPAEPPKKGFDLTTITQTSFAMITEELFPDDLLPDQNMHELRQSEVA
jgi:HK97 family phage portal protein